MVLPFSIRWSVALTHGWVHPPYFTSTMLLPVASEDILEAMDDRDEWQINLRGLFSACQNHPCRRTVFYPFWRGRLKFNIVTRVWTHLLRCRSPARLLLHHGHSARLMHKNKGSINSMHMPYPAENCHQCCN